MLDSDNIMFQFLIVTCKCLFIATIKLLCVYNNLEVGKKIFNKIHLV